MARVVTPPMTDDHYKQINNILRGCAKYRQELEVALQAKQPVSEYLKANVELCDELEAIKRAYFPDRS
jgi:hypothetical protein